MQEQFRCIGRTRAYGMESKVSNLEKGNISPIEGIEHDVEEL